MMKAMGLSMGPMKGRSNMGNTAEAIASQPFKSFDIKFPNGVRFSFEKRGQNEYKVLEGSPGKSRVYRCTFQIEVGMDDMANMVCSQKEGDFKYPDLWKKAEAMFWLTLGKDADNVWP
jgi:hypothetical protein